MQLPVKAHYAALAMLALAEKYEARLPLPARVIAQEQCIPSQFLGQILQQLRGAGLIGSTRGANGGFLLERAPESISLADVVDVVCPITSGSATSTPGTDSENPLSVTLQQVWDQQRREQRLYLESISLSELLRRSADNSPMFYI